MAFFSWYNMSECTDILYTPSYLLSTPNGTFDAPFRAQCRRIQEGVHDDSYT